MNEQNIGQQAPAPMMAMDVVPSPGAMLANADPAAVSAAAMAQSKIQIAYFMATQRPRNVREAWANIVEDCRRPGFAAVAIFRKPVGNQSIEGPSIRFAEAIIRHWRNILVLTQVVFEDDAKRRVAVHVIDTETNNQFLREIVTAKTVERKSAKDRDVVGQRLNSYGDVVYIVRATDDELAQKESAAISKIIRNEGLRMIPQDIIEDALTTARQTRANENARDPMLAIKELVYRFSLQRIPVEEIERYIGGNIDRATPSQIEELQSIVASIRDGETTWADVMDGRGGAAPAAGAATSNPKTNADTAAKTQAKAADLRDQMAAAQAAAASGAAKTTTPGGKPEAAAPDPAPEPAAQPAKEPAPVDGPAAPPAGDDPNADDPDRQVERVGFAAVDLPDCSIDELTDHANRVRGLMAPGEKKTVRAAIEGGNQEALVAVLARVARREAARGPGG